MGAAVRQQAAQAVLHATAAVGVRGEEKEKHQGARRLHRPAPQPVKPQRAGQLVGVEGQKQASQKPSASEWTK